MTTEDRKCSGKKWTPTDGGDTYDAATASCMPVRKQDHFCTRQSQELRAEQADKELSTDSSFDTQSKYRSIDTLSLTNQSP